MQTNYFAGSTWNRWDFYFKSFAIEDIEYRKDLLKLEGGKDAFKMRESKYGI